MQDKLQITSQELDILVKYHSLVLKEEFKYLKIPADAKAEILRCSKGSKIFISEITARGPDNKIRKLSDLILKLK